MKMLLKSSWRWLGLLLLTDLCFVVVAYLLRPQAFMALAFYILLFTVLIFVVGLSLQAKRERELTAAFLAYLEQPDSKNKTRLLALSDAIWQPLIQLQDEQRRKLLLEKEEALLQQVAYQEFVEAWVHEVKTPLSLLTLVLENRRAEMPEGVHLSLDYVRTHLGLDVDRILYYARLQGEHVDLVFTRLSLSECTVEVLQSFSPLIIEKALKVELKLDDVQVFSDLRTLNFILSQLISNAVKYAPVEGGVLNIDVWQDAGADGRVHWRLSDNGAGVLSQDLPFIFDKGFTGSTPERQKATGMGLYLVSKYAKALNLEVLTPEAQSTGFVIELTFPCLDLEGEPTH